MVAPGNAPLAAALLHQAQHIVVALADDDQAHGLAADNRILVAQEAGIALLLSVCPGHLVTLPGLYVKQVGNLLRHGVRQSAGSAERQHQGQHQQEKLLHHSHLFLVFVGSCHLQNAAQLENLPASDKFSTRSSGLPFVGSRDAGFSPWPPPRSSGRCNARAQSRAASVPHHRWSRCNTSCRRWTAPPHGRPR